MEKEGLPRYTPVDEYAARRHRRHYRRRFVRLLLCAAVIFIVVQYFSNRHTLPRSSANQLLSIERLQADLATCSKLRSTPKDPSGPRERNARHLEGQKPILIRNATVWTGEPAQGTSAEDARSGKGYSWIHADVFVQHGLIVAVDKDLAMESLPSDTIVWDACGRQLTAGIVDMHSHAGVDTLPNLRGSSDDNELSSDITPYVRSIDGLNPLDPHIKVIKSGGVTTSLILPGSGNNMGGEAFVIKHAVGKTDGRPEISAESMLADPDRNWRYMKMACGENPKRVYGKLGRDFGPFSRLGEAWYFRHAFEQARNYVRSQDDWCSTADKAGLEKMQSYLPQELEWESLGAVLRGQVMVNTHCYTVPDLEAFVGHTNEFQFSIRAFHHAHQTYLVPELLKRAYGNHTPAAALFADNMYYKAEAYIASEQAGAILYNNSITPVYVSDNPVLNAQHVVFEAAKAYRYGLPYHAALAGVTSASAELLGLGDRIGKVKEGFDADLVVWDSDPLSVGATPVQVWIDGVPQFDEPVELRKSVKEPLKHDVSLGVSGAEKVVSDVIFTGVSKMSLRSVESGEHRLDGRIGDVVVRQGTIACVGVCSTEMKAARENSVQVVELEDGHIVAPMTAFGSFLGLAEIAAEDDTKDGDLDGNSFATAISGLQLGTKSLKAAYDHGVTKAISAPSYKGEGHKGVSVGFRTGAAHQLEEAAVFREEVALHYTFTNAAKGDKTPSLSGAVDELKSNLLKAVRVNETAENLSMEERRLRLVVNGSMPLVITVHSADTIASILRVKDEVEAAVDSTLRLVIFGGAESHLVAKELAAAGVGVVLAPLLAYGVTWDQRRSLTGAPLTNGTAVDVLYAAGVKVAISTAEDWETRDLALMAGIIHTNSGCSRSGAGNVECKIPEAEAWKMVSSNIYDMLGEEEKSSLRQDEFVAYDGSPLEIGSRVRAVADGRGMVSVWL